MRTLVIAEIGSAWRFGDYQLHNALDAIRVAKDCGADAVKFQYCSDPRQMERRRRVPEGSYDILNWPKQWFWKLHDECQSAKIEFMCTVFLSGDVAAVDRFVQRWKVASLENQDAELFTAFKLMSASECGGRRMTMKEWCEKYGLVAAFNAGMYQEDGITIVGYMKNYRHINHGRLNKNKAVLAFNPVDSSVPEIQIIGDAK